MKRYIKMFTWKRHEYISPLLRTACEISHKHVLSVNSLCHPLWVLDYTFASHGRLRVGSPRARWKARDKNIAHLYSPDTRVWEDTTKEKNRRRHSAWVDFRGGSEAGLEKLILPEYGYARFNDPQGILGSIISTAAETGHQYGEDGFWKAQSLLCSAIQLLLHAEAGTHEVYTVRDESNIIRASDFVKEVELFIKSRLFDRITLNGIAQHVHLSESALSHRYRRETGETPMTTLHRMRIEHAKALILRGFPLKAIGYELGYSDEFHLSKTFKRITGISPREYKRKVRR